MMGYEVPAFLVGYILGFLVGVALAFVSYREGVSRGALPVSGKEGE